MGTHSERKMFMVVGRIRSGTTLLSRIVNSHPEVFVPQESPFILHLHRRYKNIGWSDKEIEAYKSDLFTEDRISQYWKFEKLGDKIERHLKALPEKNFETICRETLYLQSVNREKAGVKYLGDKNPSYSLYLPTLRKLFPEVPIIVMVRDPRTNVPSCQRVSFDFNDVSALAERWKYTNEQILKENAKGSAKLMLLKYEDLLRKPEEKIKEVCEFTGIPFDAGMLNFYEKEESLESWKNFKARPFDFKKIDEWKTKVSNTDLGIIESICGSTMKKFSYELSGKQSDSKATINTWARNKARIANRLESLIYLLPLNVREQVIRAYRKKTKTLK